MANVPSGADEHAEAALDPEPAAVARHLLHAHHHLLLDVAAKLEHAFLTRNDLESGVLVAPNIFPDLQRHLEQKRLFLVAVGGVASNDRLPGSLKAGFEPD